jgi:hypothetical protein
MEQGNLIKMSGIRVYAAIIGIAVLSAASVHSEFHALRDTWRTYKAGTQDFAVGYRQKLSGVKTLLPERGTVGYVSDSNDEGESFVTQYFVVLLVLEKGERPDLVLVNNHVPKTRPGEGEGYTASMLADGSMVYDFGNGIKLIDRRHKQ